jgi:hypothetical protein
LHELLLVLLCVVLITVDAESVSFNENLIKIVDVDKILDTVFGRFAEKSPINQIDDYIAKINCFCDTPVFEDHLAHYTIALDSQVPDALKELPAGNMSLDPHFLLGVMDGFDNEYVCISGIPRIGLNDILQFLDISHFMIYRLAVADPLMRMLTAKPG